MDAQSEQRSSVDDWLRQGIAAAKSGQRERARELLTRVVAQDEENVRAWLWLSGVVESLEDREICLENVLTIDPQNPHARKGLARLRDLKLASEPLVPIDERPPIFSEPSAPLPITPAGAILQQDFAKRQPPPEPEPKSPAPTQDVFGDEYLCPYCTAPTDPEDKRCRACGGALWVRSRVREKRSPALWMLLGFQFFATLQLMLAPVMLIVYVSLQINDARLLPDPSDLMAIADAYLGFPASPELASAAFAVVPRAVFWMSLLPALLSAGVLVALYVRWRPVYYLFVVDATLTVFAALAGIILAQNFIFGGFGLLLAVARLWLIFQVEDDFRWHRHRVLFRLDRGLSGGTDFLARGNYYARRKMWGLAALHLRRAVGLWSYDVDSRVLLASIYIRLKRYDQAARLLAEIREIEPEDPRLKDLAALLAELSPEADDV
jgi:tetratricopeptide (TPR) repeat protein